MDPNEWKHEMKRMLDSFENQAEHSLGKINRCFEAMGRPFDDDFRKYYLEMSNQRLDMTFKTVLFSKAPVRGNGIENDTIYHSATKKSTLNLLKTENGGELIEICDSDDDNHLDMRPDEIAPGMRHGPVFADNQIKMNASTGLSKHSISNQNSNSVRSSTDVGTELEVKPTIKIESNDPAIEMVEFNANEENDVSTAVNPTEGSSKTRALSNPTSSMVNNRCNCIDRKHFKCEHCDRSFASKSKLKQHRPVHANGELLDVKADSNGLYRCSYCIRQFTGVRFLSSHMKSHKNGQRLYYCARCMRPFGQESKRDRHERQCEGCHYECHLCKVYVTRNKDYMQNHMRTHSGAKPFQCMVCNKYFQKKSNLRFHLKSVHGRNKV